MNFNAENLISTLIVLGFDKVDKNLFDYVNNHLPITSIALIDEHIDMDTILQINKFLEYNGEYYSLSQGLTLKTKFFYANKEVSIEEFFRSIIVNRVLLDYTSLIDFRQYIIEKIQREARIDIDNLKYAFSNKEKELMYSMLGIKEMHRQEALKKETMFNRIIALEDLELDQTIDSLKRIRIKNERIAK